MSFLTGSRAYGNPREDSDIDLAVLLSSEELQQLRNHASRNENESAHPEMRVYKGASLRFGKLNLLVFTDEQQYLAWQVATQSMVKTVGEFQDKFFSREEAIAVIRHWTKAPLEALCNSVGQ